MCLSLVYRAVFAATSPLSLIGFGVQVQVDCVDVIQNLLDTRVPAVGGQVSKARRFTGYSHSRARIGTGTQLPKRLLVPLFVNLKKRTPLEHLSFLTSVVTP